MYVIIPNSIIQLLSILVPNQNQEFNTFVESWYTSWKIKKYFFY